MGRLKDETLFRLIHDYLKVYLPDQRCCSPNTVKSYRTALTQLLEYVRKFLKKYGDAARQSCNEIPENIHPHLFRHSRAMHLYQHGMDLTLISQWLGHSNLETSLIYAHADTEQKRRAIEKAMGKDASAGVDIPKYSITDDELLKRLYGLK